MSVTLDLSGKVAAVTGAGSGIGRATCLLLGQDGANIIAFDRSEAVFETAEMVADGGVKAVAMTGDLYLNNSPNESTAYPPANFTALRQATDDPTVAFLKANTKDF